MNIHVLWVLSRPKTLIASLSPVLIATMLILSMGFFSWLLFLSVLLTAVLLQILANVCNDWSDFERGGDTQKRIGPKRAFQTNLVSSKKIKSIILSLVTLMVLPIGVITLKGGLFIVMLWLLGICFAFCYSWGKYSFSQVGIGELIAGVFFGPFATGLIGYLFMNVWSAKLILWGISPGLFSATLLLLNNLRDIEQDKLTLRKTIPIRWGFQAGKWLAFTFVFFALFVPIMLKNSWITLLPIILSAKLLHHLIKASSPSDIIPCFKLLGPLFYISTFCTCYSII